MQSQAPMKVLQMGMNIVLTWIIRIAKHPFEVNFYLKGFIESFPMDR